MGMKSVRRTDAAIALVVRLEDQRARAVAPLDSPHRDRAGYMYQHPCSSRPSSAAMHASESNRGMQSQSIDPSRDTSAEPCRLLMNP